MPRQNSLRRRRTVDRVRLVLMWLLVAAAATFAAVACAGDNTRKAKGEEEGSAASDPFSEYSIKIYAGAERTRYDLGPARTAATGTSLADYVRNMMTPDRAEHRKILESIAPEISKELPWEDIEEGHGVPGASLKAIIDTPDGSVEIDQTVLDDPQNNPQGWALVYGAAYECGMNSVEGSIVSSEPAVSIFSPKAWPPSIVPWGIGLIGGQPFQSFYVFPFAPFTCDAVVEYEETLACIADKLAEVSEAVAPIRWSKVPPFPTTTGMPPGPWVIPPQATKDRFIARDLAIHTLAHIGLVDLARPTLPLLFFGRTDTCATIYADVSTLPGGNPVLEQLVAPTVFGLLLGTPVASLPPTLPITQPNFAALVRGRYGMQSHVLRASGRLLRDLIRDGMFADLAGGMQQRARATDPVRGGELLWGVSDRADSEFNSLAHVASLLGGRWEKGLLPDPECGGVESKELLAGDPDTQEGGLGPELSARYGDRRVRTSGQEVAAKLVDEAGIVIPDSQVEASGMTAVRDAVRTQLIEAAARRQGLPASTPDFEQDQEGRAISFLFDTISDADLRFGLERSFGAYRQLSHRTDSGAVPALDPGGGLTVGFTDPSVAGVGGVVLDGGIPRGDLTPEATARIAGLRGPSQCSELELADFGIPGALEGTLLNSDNGFLFSFQNVFGVSDTLRRRLVALREEALRVSVLAPDSDTIAVANGGVAELGAWGSTARVIGTAEDSEGLTLIDIFTIGLEPEDFGVTNVADIDANDELVLVHGEPWVADCAARLRGSCPPNFEADYVAKPTSVTDLTNGGFLDAVDRPTTIRRTGSDGSVFQIQFDLDQAPANFTPGLIGATSPNEHVYVVLRQDPANPGGAGLVLGSIEFREEDKHTGFVVSSMSTELFDDAFGVPDDFVEFGLDNSNFTTMFPVSYCIDGVPNDFFVPLENELTEDSDQYENSWRHYLNLAKEAAARVDQLGEQLIEIGTQREFRREQAQEALGDICGDFGALDDLGFDKGEVTAPENDEALRLCIDEPTVDIVFLTTDPLPDLCPEKFEPSCLFCEPKEDVTDCLKDHVLLCSGGGGSNPLCSKDTLTHAALGLAPHVVPGAASSTECEDAIDLVRSPGGVSGQKLAGLGPASWATTDNFGAVLQASSLELGADGEWQLRLSGLPVMASDPALDLWPGCLATAGPTPCADDSQCNGGGICVNATCRCDDPTEPDPKIRIFDRMYRSATAAPAELTAQDKMRLYWRVSGSLWMLGALAGEIPAETFVAPVAASKLSNAVAPAPTVFGAMNGLILRSGGGYVLDFGTEDDVNAFGIAGDIPFASGPGFAGASFEWSFFGPPQWLVDIYDDLSDDVYVPSEFVHVIASNPDISLQNHVEGFGGLPSFLTLIGGELEGISCTEMDQPSGGNFATGWERLVTTKFGGANIGASTLQNEVCPQKAGAGFSVTSQVFGPNNVTSFVGVTDKFVAGVSGQKKLKNTLKVFDTPLSGNKLGKLTLNSIDPQCQHGTLPGTQGVAPACIDDLAIGNDFLVNRSVTRPTACPAAERVRFYVNSYGAPNDCAAITELTQAMAFACTASTGGLVEELSLPPALDSIDDVPKFRAWIRAQSRAANAQLSRLFVESVPERVVRDFKGQTVGTGTLTGEHGQLILELETALQNIEGGFSRVSGSLELLEGSVENANIRLAGSEIRKNRDLEEVALRRLQVYSSMTQSVASAVGGFGGAAGPTAFSPISAVAGTANGIAQVGLGIAQLDSLDDIESLTNAAAANEVLQIMNDLRLNAIPLFEDMEGAVRDTRVATAQALSGAQRLRQSQQEAKYQAAKGTGQDYLLDEQGEPVLFPVNTVQRRQYDITRIRYQRALREARFLAYVARLAIEQRIGMRLNDIDFDLQVVEAPSVWADDICSLTGVDFEALKTFLTEDGGIPEGGVDGAAEQELIENFADQFLGDYVQRLENFVTFYNIEFPSHDAEDVSVLSVRDDLLGAMGMCTVQSPNLLLYSDRLDRFDFVADASGAPVLRGWELDPCEVETSTKCLLVSEGSALGTLDPTDPSADTVAPSPPLSGVSGGVTWLHELPNTPLGPDPDAGAAPVLEQSTVSQAVELVAGESYVLSWWDRAGDVQCRDMILPPCLPPNSLEEYRVAVFDPNGTVVTQFSDFPHTPVALDDWSDPRRTLGFTAAESGTYRISFAASTPTGAVGSVAIANVQLERTSSPTVEPSPYTSNGATRLVPSSDCASRSPADFQGAFRHRCDSPSVCFFELNTPFVIDTTGLEDGQSRLTGKLAAGNFNFRHIDVALNVVGTGVLDCSKDPDPACFGSAFVEASLVHDAFDTPVIDHNNDVRHFDFGSAAINRMKALASERFITIPLSSADQGLLGQPQTTKPEFRGRPLSGSYRLRIYDKPSLDWGRVEDVQLILTYRYWSRVERQPPAE